MNTKQNFNYISGIVYNFTNVLHNLSFFTCFDIFHMNLKKMLVSKEISVVFYLIVCGSPIPNFEL